MLNKLTLTCYPVNETKCVAIQMKAIELSCSIVYHAVQEGNCLAGG